MIGRLLAPVAALLALAGPVGAQVVNPPVAYGAGDAPPALSATATPLPGLPLPVGAKVMGFGDSLIAFSHGAATITTAGVTNGAAFNRPSGVLATAWMDDPRWNGDTWYDPAPGYSAKEKVNGANQGIAGDHLDDNRISFGNGCLPRTRYATARAPDIVYLLCGTNTIYSGDNTGGKPTLDPAYLTAKLDQIISQFTSRGTWVVISTLYPRGDFAAATLEQQRATINAVNVWIRAQAGRAGVKVVDPYGALGTTANPDAPNPALFQSDLVHPNIEGARVIAQQFVQPVLATMIAAGSVFNQDASVDNLYPQSLALMNGGTAGEKTRANVGSQLPTGNVATGFTVATNRGNTTTVAASIEDAGAYKRQVLSINSVGETVNRYATINFNMTAKQTVSIPAGTWVRQYLHVETPDADSASLILLYGSAASASTTLVSARGSYEGTSAFYDTRASGRGGYWIATTPFQWPAGADRTSQGVEIYIRNSITGPVTVKFDRPILRVVPDPRPAWGL